MIRLVFRERGQEAVLEEVTAIVLFFSQHAAERHVKNLPSVIVFEECRELAVGEIRARRDPVEHGRDVVGAALVLIQ
jgi:hypothetical protein